MAVQLGPITRAEALSRLDSQPVIIRRYVAHLKFAVLDKQWHGVTYFYWSIGGLGRLAWH